MTRRAWNRGRARAGTTGSRRRSAAASPGPPRAGSGGPCSCRPPTAPRGARWRRGRTGWGAGAAGRGEVEEWLGPLRLDVPRFLQVRHRLVVLLGPAVEEAELHPRVDRAGIGLEDLLQLGARLVVLARVHQRGGPVGARAHVARLPRHRPAARAPPPDA